MKLICGPAFHFGPVLSIHDLLSQAKAKFVPENKFTILLDRVSHLFLELIAFKIVVAFRKMFDELFESGLFGMRENFVAESCDGWIDFHRGAGGRICHPV